MRSRVATNPLISVPLFVVGMCFWWCLEFDHHGWRQWKVAISITRRCLRSSIYFPLSGMCAHPSIWKPCFLRWIQYWMYACRNNTSEKHKRSHCPSWRRRYYTSLLLSVCHIISTYLWVILGRYCKWYCNEVSFGTVDLVRLVVLLRACRFCVKLRIVYFSPVFWCYMSFTRKTTFVRWFLWCHQLWNSFLLPDSCEPFL